MVEESNQYWQLQKQEIPSLCPTAISLGSGTTTIQDTNGIITGTGTTGCTIDGDPTNGGYGIIIGGLILMLFLGAHLLDRKLNRKSNLDRELRDLDNQNQE